MLASKLLSVTTFAAARSSIMPILALALGIDSCIVGIWYMIGSVLGNDRVKGTARGEAYQLVGTIILAFIIIGFMTAFGSLFYNILGGTKMNPSVMGTMCHNLENYNSNGGLAILGSSNSLLSSPSTTSGSSFEGICDLVSGPATQTPTGQIDYPLAAAATIIANVTNQTAGNLDTAFRFDAFLGFLSALKPDGGICVTESQFESQCFGPFGGLDTPPGLFDLKYSFQPYAGYDLLLDNLGTLGVVLTTSLEMCTAELIFVVMCLYIWPYMLFIGLILRSTIFTRSLGGLFIAIAIAIVMIFPATYAIEYLTLSNPIPSSTASAYGFTSLPTLKNASNHNSGYQDYTLNFFVQPNLGNIVKYYNCALPTSGTGALLGAEFIDIAFLLIPFVSIVPLLVSTDTTGVPPIYLPVNCPNWSGASASSAVLPIFYEFMNAYGIMGINIYLLPLLNIIIAMTAMLGLSGILGGDTNLAGLAKLIPG